MARRRALLAFALALGVALAACGSTPAPGASSSAGSSSSSASTKPLGRLPVVAVRATDLGALLPRGLEGTAAVTVGGGVDLLGGSGSGGYFNATVYRFTVDASGAPHLSVLGALPQALHDAGAVAAGANALLCGGGQSVGTNTVYRIAPAGAVTVAGHLPRVLSDLVGVELAGRAYCLGGWTGQLYSDAVYEVGGLSASSPQPALVAHLPHAVRYAAAVAVTGGVLVAGGLVDTGRPTGAVQWLPLSATRVHPTVISALPRPLYKAMAAPLGPDALLVGGCGADGKPVATIYTLTGAGGVNQLGSLPVADCYGSAAALGGDIYVFGGLTAGGAPSAHVYRLAPVQQKLG